MSTVIVGGYILRTSNSKKVEAVNMRLRELFSTLAKENAYTVLADLISVTANYYANPKVNHVKYKDSKTFLDFLANHVYELKDPLPIAAYNHHSKYNNNLFDAGFSIIRAFTNNNLDSSYNLSRHKIYFKTSGKNTVYFFAMNSELINAFNRINDNEHILESFDYWDNTDQPEDVNKTQWSFRRKVWNGILGKKHSVSDVMNNIPIHLSLDEIRREHVIPYLHDEHSRLKSIYKKTRLLDLMNEKSKKETAEDLQDTSVVTGIYFDCVEILMKEVSDGCYLTSTSHLLMMESQDDFIKRIFNESNDIFYKENDFVDE